MAEAITRSLVGESGSGKTTVARMILGLVQPTRGSIRVECIDVARPSRTNGRLVEIGEAESLCANPREPYTRKLLEATLERPTSAA